MGSTSSNPVAPIRADGPKIAAEAIPFAVAWCGPERVVQAASQGRSWSSRSQTSGTGRRQRTWA